jgi:hypothetical protein
MRGCVVGVFFLSASIFWERRSRYILERVVTPIHVWHWLGMLMFAGQKCVHSIENKQGALQGALQEACASASAINSFW